MFSFTTGRNYYGSLTNDTSAANLTLGDTLINTAMRSLLTTRPWDFKEKTATITTVASQQFYNLPFDFEKLIYTTVTVGTTIYTPQEAPSRQFWDRLNENTSVTSNIPEWFYIFNNQIGFYPKPSSITTNGITVIYQRTVKDLSVADYTTGTITTTTNGGTTVVGSGTTWTAQMANRFIRITDGDAAGSGDGVWYEISSVTNATTLVLTKNYNGTSIAAGSTAYAIAQVSILPEAYQILPIYKAIEVYFSSLKPTPNLAAMYKRLYDEGFGAMLAEHGSKTTNPSIASNTYSRINPNLGISL